MKSPKASTKPAGAPTPSTPPLTDEQIEFHKWAAQVAQEVVDNLNRNALADKAKYDAALDAMGKRTK
jgi:hypothetical protein